MKEWYGKVFGNVVQIWLIFTKNSWKQNLPKKHSISRIFLLLQQTHYIWRIFPWKNMPIANLEKWTKLFFLLIFFSLFQKSNVIIHRRLKMASLKLLTSRTTISTARRPPIIVIQALYFGVCHFHVKKSMMNHMSSLFAWKKKTREGGGVERFWPFCPPFFVKSLQDWLSLEEKSNISIFAIEKLSQMSLPCSYYFLSPSPIF